MNNFVETFYEYIFYLCELILLKLIMTEDEKLQYKINEDGTFIDHSNYLNKEYIVSNIISTKFISIKELTETFLVGTRFNIFK